VHCWYFLLCISLQNIMLCLQTEFWLGHSIRIIHLLLPSVSEVMNYHYAWWLFCCCASYVEEPWKESSRPFNMPWLTRLVADLSRPKARFDAWPVRIRCVENKVVLGEIFCECFGFCWLCHCTSAPCPFSFFKHRHYSILVTACLAYWYRPTD
jgi:hypothetical protein